MSTGVRIAVAGALAVALTAVPVAANAALTSASREVVSAGAATLHAPGDVAIRCFGSDGRVTISWSATPDVFADGYTVLVSGEPAVAVSDATITSVTPKAPVPAGATVSVAAIYRNWTSEPSAPVEVTDSCA